MPAPRRPWPTPTVKLLMKRRYTVAAMGPEETNTPFCQTVFETGHGSGETGIANDACTHRNNAVEKHEARPLGHDLFETPAPGQENLNEGLYRDKAQQLSDGSSEDLEILDTESSEGPGGLGPICFCPDTKPDAPQNAETAGDAYSIGLYYLKLRETFGIKPVRVHNRKTVMRAIVRAAVHRIIKHCLREKQNEDCSGCAIDAPGQRHHACVYWSLYDVNCKIKEISGSLCMESVLNIIITLGYALQCLCLTQEHLALGAELVDKVTEAKNPNSILDEIIKPTDKCLMQNVEHLLRSANYKILLRKDTNS